MPQDIITAQPSSSPAGTDHIRLRRTDAMARAGQEPGRERSEHRVGGRRTWQIAAGPITRNGAARRAMHSAPSVPRRVTSTASAVVAAKSVVTIPAAKPPREERARTSTT